MHLGEGLRVPQTPECCVQAHGHHTFAMSVSPWMLDSSVEEHMRKNKGHFLRTIWQKVGISLRTTVFNHSEKLEGIHLQYGTQP